MQAEFLLLLLVVGAGNYLIRFLPFFWALRRGATVGEESRTDGDSPLDVLLPFVGPSVVVALLVTSVLAEASSGAGLVRAGVALLPTLVTALRTRNLGLTVLVGALAYWLVSLVA